RITSSDSGATLPPNAALSSGTKNFNVTLNSSGSFTVTATDFTDGTKTANTSPAITVNSAQLTQLTGGSAISADATVGTYTNLTGPTYTESASSNVSPGTIILNVPSGFVFDTGGTAPSVRIDRLGGSGSSANNINGVATGASVAMSSIT